ncbi:hypothetical protein HDU97_007941 [Phlyctochytrium planicorne]|nr:hypothetical protein HDU97_007941 [Phlyctochytrium planicorne]
MSSTIDSNTLLTSPDLTSEGNTPFTAVTASKVSDFSTIMLSPTEQSVINFSAYMMMQGFFLGTSMMFLYRAAKLFLEKRNLLTLADCIQLLFWIIRTLIIITFNIAPSSFVDCSWRQYAAGVASSSVIVTVWWLQYIKFQAMYRDRPAVCYTVMAICIVCVAACFPFMKTVIKIDSLDHCSVSFDSTMQIVYISTDVFVNLLLSALFGLAIWKHISTTDSNWNSYSKMTYILTCDVRGAFVDTLAQLIKLGLNLSSLPSSQSVFGAHVCDWVKIAAAHWFVNDVVGSQKETTCSNCSGTNPSMKGSGIGKGSGNGLAGARARAASAVPSNGRNVMALSTGEERAAKKNYDLEASQPAIVKSNQTLNE